MEITYKIAYKIAYEIAYKMPTAPKPSFLVTCVRPFTRGLPRKFAEPCSGRVRSLALSLKSNKKQTQHHFEFEIEQNTKTTTVELKKSNKKQTQQQSNWSNDSAIVSVFVELLNCCSFLFNYCLLLRKSLTLGGLSRSPGTCPSPPVSLFGGTFFHSVFLHSFFQQKTTFVTNWTPKMTPKFIPNLALDLFCCIFSTRSFCCPARCFWSISLFPPVPKHTQTK